MTNGFELRIEFNGKECLSSRGHIATHTHTKQKQKKTTGDERKYFKAFNAVIEREIYSILNVYI
jgi:hypothetical protein